MLRKILLGAGVLTLFVAAYAGYDYYLKLKSPKTNILQTIPDDALLIIKTKKTKQVWDKLASTNIIWEELKSIPFFKNIHSRNSLLDSLMTDNETLNDLVSKNGLIASVHIDGQTLNWLYTMRVPFYSSRKKVIKAIKNLTDLDESNQRSVNGVDVYSTGETKISIVNDVLFVSRSSILIDKAVTYALSSHSNNKSLEKVASTKSNNVDINLFVNFQYFDRFLKLFLKEDTKKLLLDAHPFANWSELDVLINPNTIALNGFTNNNDSLGLISLFDKQSPQEPKIISILPENVSSFIIFGLSKIDDYVTDYRSKIIKDLKAHKAEINSINKKHGIDIESGFLSWIGHQMVVYSAPVNGNKNESFIGFDISVIDNPHPKLAELSERINTDDEKIKSSTYKGITIKAIPEVKNYGLLLGKVFDVIKTPHYAILENYVLFGNSFHALKSQIDHVLNGTSLSKSGEFDSFYSNNFFGSTNLLMYCNLSQFAENLVQRLNNKYKFDVDLHIDLIEKFEAVAWQINKDKNNLYYNNLFLKYNPAHKVASNSLWEVDTENDLVGQPILIYNHRTQTKDILIQDSNHNLYLIDNKGNIQWKKQLDHRIVGHITQIDAFKNGKLQILLNSENAIYLIDILGRNVEGFPIKLPKKATNQVIAIDYDKEKDYRILIACEDGELYNFDKKGKKIAGWNYSNTGSPIISQPKHFVIGKKDYIYCHDDDGKILLLNRKGEVRHNVESNISNRSSNPAYLEVGSTIENSKIVYSDKSGKIKQLFFSGSTSEYSVTKTLSESHHFIYSNINQSISKEYIFLDSNKLSVFEIDKATLFDLKLDNPISNTPKIYKFNNGNYQIGLTDSLSQKTFLIDRFGNIQEQSIFNGSSPFAIGDINKDGVFELIVANSDKKIYAYVLEHSH